MDWLSFDLPHEADAVLAGDVVDRDVDTCGPHERLRELAERVDGRPYVVVNEQRVVMGVVEADPRLVDDATTVAEVMQVGATTVRPSEDLAGLLERMERADVESIVVTRPDGVLVGLLDRRRAT